MRPSAANQNALLHAATTLTWVCDSGSRDENASARNSTTSAPRFGTQQRLISDALEHQTVHARGYCYSFPDMDKLATVYPDRVDLSKYKTFPSAGPGLFQHLVTRRPLRDDSPLGGGKQHFLTVGGLSAHRTNATR